jgi:alpha-glucosidase
MRRAVRVVLLLLLLVPPVPASAQWMSLGNMPGPSISGQTITWRNDQGIVALTAVAPDVIRVRFAPGRALGRDHSYAVVNRQLGDGGAKFVLNPGRSVIQTGKLVITVKHQPFRIAIADADGHDLDADDPEKGIAFSGRTVRVWKRLRDDEQVYGLGEKTGRLNKRGRQLGGYNVTMWNSDTYAYEADTDPIYASIPFFMVLRAGVAHGIFLDNTFRSNFDIGHQSQGLLSFGADGGELNYYFIYGPTPKQVVSRYTDLTGRMPLPPLWSLGYHQCRYSYYPERAVRFIAENFRVRRIPADTIWLDIHYLEGYAPFTWDPERFPDPGRLVGDLARDGFKVVTIIDPHIKKQTGMASYDSGLAGGHFIKSPDGAVYEAPVWPARAEKNPGPSVFPDFSRPATREWWGGLYGDLAKLGVAGIWNDMNEPAVFDTPTGTMPLDVRHDNEGQPTDHREIHNVYGQLMTRGTYEGLLRLRPDERPFVLTRATYAGGQRYAAAWPGDNVSDWAALRGAISTLLGMGLSGLSFVGVDIGGFAESPTAELYTRWLQSGLFYPFMRSHTTFGTAEQEPWSYGPQWEALNRRIIELRYELLPTIYNVMRESSVSGVPAMRPLMLEFPGDPATHGMDDQYMFGSDILVAPVLRESITTRSVYLPKGHWFDFWTGKRFEGGQGHNLPVTIASLPLFVRGGAFIFRQPVVQHTGQVSGLPLTVEVYPADGSDAWLYEDDGRSLAYQRGESMRRRFAQSRTASGTSVNQIRIDVGAPEGSYRPASRSLLIAVLTAAEPQRVTVDGAALARYSPSDLEKQATGWTVDARGFVVVKMPDRFASTTVLVEH